MKNLESPYFDMWEADLGNGKKLVFVAEAESRWEKAWSPSSMLEECEEALRDHADKAHEEWREAPEKGYEVPKKGYVFAMHMLQGEIEIWWKEVDLSEIGK